MNFQQEPSEDVLGGAPSGASSSPGKTSSTSRLAPRAQQIVFRVESAEAAAVLADKFGPRDDNGVAAGAGPVVARAAAGIGTPLPAPIRAQFEGSLGADLSAVRVHTGADSAEAAGAVGARAYTTGNDIHFGAGQYAPADPFGLHLLAHEVAHTQQQAGSAPSTQYKLEVSAPGDAAEVEADRAADAMVSGAPAVVGGASGLSRQTIQREAGKPAADDQGLDPKRIDVLQVRIEMTQKKLAATNAKFFDGVEAAHKSYEQAKGWVNKQSDRFKEAYDAFIEALGSAKKGIEAEDEFKKFILDTALTMVVGGASEGLQAAEAAAKESPAVVHVVKEFAKEVGMAEVGVLVDEAFGTDTAGKDKVDGEGVKTAGDHKLAAILKIDAAMKGLDALNKSGKQLLPASQTIGNADKKLEHLKSKKGAEPAKELAKIEGAMGMLATINGNCAALDKSVAKQVAKAGFTSSLAEKQNAAATKDSMSRRMWGEWLKKLDAEEFKTLRDKDGISGPLKLYNLYGDFGGNDAARSQKAVGKTAQSYGGAGTGFKVRVDGMDGTFTAVLQHGKSAGPGLGLDTLPSGQYGTVVGVDMSGNLVVAAHFVAPDQGEFVGKDNANPMMTTSMTEILAKEKQPTVVTPLSDLVGN